MLRPVQLYKEEINKKFINIWYDLDYMWYAMDAGLSIYDPDDNNRNHHSFVSVNSEGDVLGVMSYTVDWGTMSARNLGIMAFSKFNLTFGRDLRQLIEDIFYKHNLNRLSFCSVADNPAIRSYRRFISQHGGVECGYERQCCRLIDGKLHDIVTFEILAKEFKENHILSKS